MRSEALRKEKKMRRNNIIIGSILLFLMIFSMLAVTVGNSNNSNPDLVYGNYTFKIEDVSGGQGQMATIKINGQKYAFYTLPRDAESRIGNISYVRDIASAPEIIFVKDPLAIGGQSSSEELYFDAVASDLQASGKIILSGISKPDEFSDKQVYACGDASQSAPLVKLGNGTFASMNIKKESDNCYVLESDTASLLAFRDYVLYKSLGIIQ